MLMDDHLEQQLVNELRSLLQSVNETYKDFYHIQLITLCDMKDMSCPECKQSTFGQQCKRCVIGYEEISRQPEPMNSVSNKMLEDLRNSPEEMVYLKEIERNHNRLIEEMENKTK
jgi:hypothetical protein